MNVWSNCGISSCAMDRYISLHQMFVGCWSSSAPLSRGPWHGEEVKEGKEEGTNKKERRPGRKHRAS